MIATNDCLKSLGSAAIAMLILSGLNGRAFAQVTANDLSTATAEVERARELSGACLVAVRDRGRQGRQEESCQQFIDYWQTSLAPRLETYQAIADRCDADQLPAPACNTYIATLNEAGAILAELTSRLQSQ